MAASTHSYIIVGAGVFGVSTALQLIKKYPNTSVTLVDRDAFDAESRVAASWDWNKVVRADYDDIVYCKLGIEAQDVFKTDPLWKPYFYESGIFWTCRNDYANEVIENYKKLGRKADLKSVSVSEARKQFPLFDEADFSGVQEVLLNRTSGFALAGLCLENVTREAIRLGVKYKVAEVDSLHIDGRGRCTGIMTKRGESLTASRVILSTGAYTPKLLELCAKSSGVKSLSADGRIVAGGITTGLTAPLDDKTYAQYATMPVGVQGYFSPKPFIGSLPPTKDRELKWWGQTIFTNTREVLPGKFISMPPPESDYAQWKVPQKLKDDIDYANHVFYGKRGKDWNIAKYRICWDAFTTSADFIISPHSAAEGLYVATCGNFHGWKFFPVLGKYVVQMLEGELESELKEKWAWDRERPSPDANPDWPRTEMKDVLSHGPAKL